MTGRLVSGPVRRKGLVAGGCGTAMPGRFWGRRSIGLTTGPTDLIEPSRRHSIRRRRWWIVATPGAEDGTYRSLWLRAQRGPCCVLRLPGDREQRDAGEVGSLRAGRYVPGSPGWSVGACPPGTCTGRLGIPDCGAAITGLRSVRRTA